MGFYGNITNTSNTTFSFDAIYPNRRAMDSNANNDGIFIGRYVLVEYQEDAAYPVGYHKESAGNNQYQYYFYSSTNQEDVAKIRYLGDPSQSSGEQDVNTSLASQDGFYKGEILRYYEYDSNNKFNPTNEFYECIDGNKDGDALFEEISNPLNKTDYIQNFAIDEEHYGQGSRGFKGYDSTVWTKTSIKDDSGKLITKYVQIADLNSVVPTFDIAADAPTMVPITPHFDADSTNVYYKLHVQTPYGFRIKEAKNEDGSKLPSDQTTTHYETIYDKNGNITSQEKRENVEADIFYNKNALEYKFNDSTNRVKKEPKGEDEIKLTISKSKNYDSKYQHKTEGEPQGDIQELSIHLPSVGYMVSQGWDVIHGPNRDDDMREFDTNGKNVSSLKGRLDSIDALEDDTIPIKRNIDGKLVGNKINGGKTTDIDYTGKDDDEWIETLVNGNEEKITIHHTYDLEDKNKYKDIGHLEEPLNIDNDTSNKINLNDGTNTLDINTPIVDSMGHVVGKNTETVTLPYGYKSLVSWGFEIDEEKSTCLYTEQERDEIRDKIAAEGDDRIKGEHSSTTANNTQDILRIVPYNKWIQTRLQTDILEIAHEVHDITTDEIKTTDLNDNVDIESNTITIQDTLYDAAGHVTANQKHTYVLPYGYKTIQANNTDAITAAPDNATASPTADNTQDILKLNASNKWIKFNTLDDIDNPNEVQIGHLIQSEEFGKTYYALNNDLQENETYKQTPNFGSDVKILNVTVDNAGHVTGFGANTITIPKGSCETKNNIDADNNVIQTASLLSSIALNSESGKITARYNTTNSIKLSGYNTNKINNHSNDTSDVADNDTLNTAFAKLQNQIIAEEEARKEAINTLYGDDTVNIADTFDTIKEIANFLEQDSSNGKTGVEIIIDDIATLKGDSTVSGSVTNSIKTAIEGLDSSKSADTNKYISGITITDGKITEIQQTALGSAAYKDEDYFAKAEQGSKADSAIQLDTTFTYGTELKTIQELMNIVKDQADTISELSDTIKNLDDRIKVLEEVNNSTPTE